MVPARFDYPEITSALMGACRVDLSFLYENKYTKSGYCAHQTVDCLFSDQSPVWNQNWDVLKQTFISSVVKFINRPFDVKAWCFASFPKVKNLQWAWHEHSNAEYSAVLYLSLPKDKDDNHCFTTEFLQPDGKSLFIEPKMGSWFVFPGTAVHRNGFWDYENMSDIRYCIAASALKQK